MLVRFHFDILLKTILLKKISKVWKMVNPNSIFTFFGSTTSYKKSQAEYEGFKVKT
jgi:hypothetical protein